MILTAEEYEAEVGESLQTLREERLLTALLEDVAKPKDKDCGETPAQTFLNDRCTRCAAKDLEIARLRATIRFLVKRIEARGVAMAELAGSQKPSPS